MRWLIPVLLFVFVGCASVPSADLAEIKWRNDPELSAIAAMLFSSNLEYENEGLTLVERTWPRWTKATKNNSLNMLIYYVKQLPLEEEDDRHQRAISIYGLILNSINPIRPYIQETLR